MSTDASEFVSQPSTPAGISKDQHHGMLMQRMQEKYLVDQKQVCQTHWCLTMQGSNDHMRQAPALLGIAEDCRKQLQLAK